MTSTRDVIPRDPVTGEIDDPRVVNCVFCDIGLNAMQDTKGWFHPGPQGERVPCWRLEPEADGGRQ